MAKDLTRLLNPKSIAVIGGGAWCEAVITQTIKLGFKGDVWPVHPTKNSFAGRAVYRSVRDLPAAPDASFIGVNSKATIEIVRELNLLGAGGAICFASGFLETGNEKSNDDLLVAAGDMPLLGPNCYGFINYLSKACLWPDQHGGEPVDKGVAILAQSSNIAMNITMQQRGLPLAFIGTLGNQSQLNMADLGLHLVQDPRITAIGCYVEGFGDLTKWQQLCEMAQELNKPITILKAGRTATAQAATISHTASIAGNHSGALAFINKLGFTAVESLSEMLETLKLQHLWGKLPTAKISSMSCSGGEASLMADCAEKLGLAFPKLSTQKHKNISELLGPLATPANPLDYHTDIWRDKSTMAKVFAEISDPDTALSLVVLDLPRADRADPKDWHLVIDAIIQAKEKTGTNYAVISSLADNMPELVAKRLMREGIAPLCGLEVGLQAVANIVEEPKASNRQLLPAKSVPKQQHTWTEASAKRRLARHGIVVPRWLRCTTLADAEQAAQAIGWPVVLKLENIAHKTENNGVHLNLKNVSQLADVISYAKGKSFIIEDMIEEPIAELLIGILRDPAHGYLLFMAAGGSFAELMPERQALLLPVDASDIKNALNQLSIGTILCGYRGKPAANIDSIVEQIMAVQNFVIQNLDEIIELEINPLIVTKNSAIAADALLVCDANYPLGENQ